MGNKRYECGIGERILEKISLLENSVLETRRKKEKEKYEYTIKVLRACLFEWDV